MQLQRHSGRYLQACRCNTLCNHPSNVQQRNEPNGFLPPVPSITVITSRISAIPIKRTIRSCWAYCQLASAYSSLSLSSAAAAAAAVLFINRVLTHCWRWNVWYVLCNYTPWVKKDQRYHSFIAYCWPMLKTLSPLDSAKHYNSWHFLSTP